MVRVPSQSYFDPIVGAHLHTGANVQDRVHDMPTGTKVAIDTETKGKDEPFATKCLTAAWTMPDGRTHAVLLDPVRNDIDKRVAQDLIHRAGSLVLHNAPFDMPPLVHYGLAQVEDCNKVIDTLVLARMAWPNPPPFGMVKTLENLVVRLLGWSEVKGGMKRAFSAAGYSREEDGWANMDIDVPIYRQGAMFDTIGTLRIEPKVRDECFRTCLDHPFPVYGCTTPAQAAEVIAKQEVVHRVMLRRTARGIRVDRDYLADHAETIDEEKMRCEDRLAEHGLVGGKGKGAALVQYLHERGELPSPWPRTPKKGELRATKKDMEVLVEYGIPLAVEQMHLSDYEQVQGYLIKTDYQAETTGRCHSQVNTLGASATGRMSYGSPPLQQFNKGARPILVDDGQGFTSIDWSQIEPVVMGCMAQDRKFLAPYDAGEDMYAPLMAAADIDRDLAKINLLATMYGRGIPSLARSIGKTEEEAATIRRKLLNAMPVCKQWMSHVAWIAQEYGAVPTGDGRILPVDPGGTFKAVNYVVQGTAYGVLADTIIEMERQGIGDHIQLALHDELVVDTEVAEEVQRIMVTPPDWLIRCTGWTPTLRTDRNDMGSTWKKV